MTIYVGFLADPHLAERPNRTNIQTLWNRKLWQHIDAKGKGETRHVYRPSSHDSRPLLAASEFMKSVATQLDLLVLLGDLATTGQSQDITVASQVFAEALTKRHITKLNQPRFGGLGIPIHVVPGNHDRYQDDIGTPGGKLFDAAFRKYYKPTHSVCQDTLSKGGLTLGVISADFTYLVNEPVNRLKKLGWGRVNRIVLDELERQTSRWQDQNPNKPIIWAIHFSPSESVSSLIKLENRSDVIDLAKKLGVNHVFCGHTHERRREIGSKPHLYNAGSVSSVDCRGQHFLHVCEVSKQGREYNLNVKDFIFDEDLDEFVESSPSFKA